MSGADAALQRAIADACLAAGAGEAMAADLRVFLEQRGVPAEDVEAILAAPVRLAVYRSLVRNGLASVVVQMLPRTRARLNATAADRFEANLGAFLDAAAPRTHYLRDVPAEFLAWVAPRWKADPTVPAYLPDLAAHELAHFAVAAAAPSRAPGQPAIALDRPLAFAESMRLMSHGWAVHELPADEDATDPPARREVHLLAHRDAEHAVKWVALSPLAAAVIGRLAEGEPLGAAIERACADQGVAPAAVLPDVARLLANLGARGVLVGTAAP